MKDMIIGVDLAKNVFQLHGTSPVRKKLTRKQFPVFMAQQEPCLVIFEACGSAHYWARDMEALGHEVKLIAPQYARPFVKRQKNDAADAEAIVIAARQPEMRFVAPKTVEQQACAAVFRGRERLVYQRTADVNALRALLYEHGHVFPSGIGHLARMMALVQDMTSDLPTLIRDECRDLLDLIAVLVAAVFSPKVATEISPPVSGNANSKLQIFGIGAVAGSRPDALIEARQGQSGERIEGDRFDPRFTTTGAEHLGHRAQGWF